MLRLRTRTVARHRAVALVAVLLLIWCQVVAAVHATTVAGAGLSSDDVAAEMAAMGGCDGLPDTASDGSSDCLSEDATSDAGKLPVFLPLPPADPFAQVRHQQNAPAGLVRYELPQGRAPPRSRLCTWLI